MKHTLFYMRAALLLWAVMLAGSAAPVAATAGTTTPAVSAAQAPALRVALVMEKDYPDPALVAGLHQGLERARQDLGISLTLVHTPDASVSLGAAEAQEEAFRQAAARHDVVVVATPALHEILMNQAGNYRKTRFVSLGAEVKAEHIASVILADNEAAFLAGAAAATLATRPGIAVGSPGTPPVLGWMGAFDLPRQRAELEAFLQGAKLVHPEARVVSAFTNTLADVGAGRKAALDLYSRGAAIVAHSAGQSGQGALGAAQELSRYALNQAHILPPENSGEAHTLFTSYVRTDEALYQVLRAAGGNAFPGNTTTEYGLAQNMAGLAGLGALQQRMGANFPADLPKRLEQLIFEIQRGGITVPKAQKKTLCDCL